MLTCEHDTENAVVVYDNTPFHIGSAPCPLCEATKEKAELATEVERLIEQAEELEEERDELTGQVEELEKEVEELQESAGEKNITITNLYAEIAEMKS